MRILPPLIRPRRRNPRKARPKSKSKKPKKEKKTKEKNTDKGKGSTPRNTPRKGNTTEATAAPAQSSKGNKQPKPSDKNKGGSTTPRSKAVKKAQDMTPQEKAKTPCIFFPFDACKATKCEFLHDRNDMYKGPPPRSVRFAQKPNKDKVNANVAVVQPIFATPALSENKVSWLWDTAAGRHLFGKQALTPSMKQFCRHPETPLISQQGGVASRVLIR